MSISNFMGSFFQQTVLIRLIQPQFSGKKLYPELSNFPFVEISSLVWLLTAELQNR